MDGEHRRDLSPGPGQQAGSPSASGAAGGRPHPASPERSTWEARNAVDSTDDPRNGPGGAPAAGGSPARGRQAGATGLRDWSPPVDPALLSPPTGIPLMAQGVAVPDAERAVPGLGAPAVGAPAVGAPVLGATLRPPLARGPLTQRAGARAGWGERGGSVLSAEAPPPGSPPSRQQPAQPVSPSASWPDRESVSDAGDGSQADRPDRFSAFSAFSAGEAGPAPASETSGDAATPDGGRGGGLNLFGGPAVEPGSGGSGWGVPFPAFPQLRDDASRDDASRQGQAQGLGSGPLPLLPIRPVFSVPTATGEVRWFDPVVEPEPDTWQEQEDAPATPSATAQPVALPPSTSQPAATQPATSQPAATQPATSQPAAKAPGGGGTEHDRGSARPADPVTMPFALPIGSTPPLTRRARRAAEQAAASQDAPPSAAPTPSGALPPEAVPAPSGPPPVPSAASPAPPVPGQPLQPLQPGGPGPLQPLQLDAGAGGYPPPAPAVPQAPAAPDEGLFPGTRDQTRGDTPADQTRQQPFASFGAVWGEAPDDEGDDWVELPSFTRPAPVSDGTWFTMPPAPAGEPDQAAPHPSAAHPPTSHLLPPGASAHALPPLPSAYPASFGIPPAPAPLEADPPAPSARTPYAPPPPLLGAGTQSASWSTPYATGPQQPVPPAVPPAPWNPPGAAPPAVPPAIPPAPAAPAIPPAPPLASGGPSGEVPTLQRPRTDRTDARPTSGMPVIRPAAPVRRPDDDGPADSDSQTMIVRRSGARPEQAAPTAKELFTAPVARPKDGAPGGDAGDGEGPATANLAPPLAPSPVPSPVAPKPPSLEVTLDPSTMPGRGAPGAPPVPGPPVPGPAFGPTRTAPEPARHQDPTREEPDGPTGWVPSAGNGRAATTVVPSRGRGSRARRGSRPGSPEDALVMARDDRFDVVEEDGADRGRLLSLAVFWAPALILLVLAGVVVWMVR